MRCYSKCICRTCLVQIPYLAPVLRPPLSCPDDCLWILFCFQDSNPFASLVFYWEPLHRQVSEYSWDSRGWTGGRRGLSLWMNLVKVPRLRKHPAFQMALT